MPRVKLQRLAHVNIPVIPVVLTGKFFVFVLDAQLRE